MIKNANLAFLAIYWTFSSIVLSGACVPICDYLTDIEIQHESSGLFFVDCVYVINLERRPNKWKKTKEILWNYRIHSNRVNAIDGWLLPEDVMQTLSGNYPIRLKGGQYGCFLSHLSIIQHAYKQGYHCIWVCEDDIAICENPHQLGRLVYNLSRLRPDWDILYTDVDAKNHQGMRILSLSSDFRPDFVYEPLSYYLRSIPVTHEIIEIGQRFGAYSMLISRSGIEKIWNHLSTLPIWTSYDIDIHYIPNIKEFGLNRDIVSIDLRTPSDTEHDFTVNYSEHNSKTDF